MVCVVGPGAVLVGVVGSGGCESTVCVCVCSLSESGLSIGCVWL